jgi:hypothetical protein
MVSSQRSEVLAFATVCTRFLDFDCIFLQTQGLVHLEALEMLSEQCNIKLQSVLLTNSGNALSQLQQSLHEVRVLCQLPDDEDTEMYERDAVEWREMLDGVTKGLGVPFATDKLNEVIPDVLS